MDYYVYNNEFFIISHSKNIISLNKIEVKP